MQFPAVDPIPLPAPVWLRKLLGLVTLSLHFAAVMLLVGSLLLDMLHTPTPDSMYVKYMPPLVGRPEEREALAKFLATVSRPGAPAIASDKENKQQAMARQLCTLRSSLKMEGGSLARAFPRRRKRSFCGLKG